MSLFCFQDSILVTAVKAPNMVANAYLNTIKYVLYKNLRWELRGANGEKHGGLKK